MQFQLIKNQLDREKHSSENRSNNIDLAKISNQNNIISEKENLVQEKPFHFQTNFQGYMEMYCDRDSVGRYLDCHQDWFKNCAKPMIAIPLGDNGYTLTVGRFGSFGYEIEAKIDVVMRSLGKSKYIMHTVDFPHDRPLGYKVDYQAALQISEIATKSIARKINNKKLIAKLPEQIAKVEWELNLAVAVQFPKFIHKLPASAIQTTGDRLLTQIVKQVSPLLSYKVQKDFHSRHNLPVPGRNSRNCEKVSRNIEIRSVS